MKKFLMAVMISSLCVGVHGSEKKNSKKIAIYNKFVVSLAENTNKDVNHIKLRTGYGSGANRDIIAAVNKVRNKDKKVQKLAKKKPNNNKK